VHRELAAYELADTIVVPSQHVADSFAERGYDDSIVKRVPFGVDLSMFPETRQPRAEKPRILMVGNWCLRKGCDVLTQAWRELSGVELMHVGPVGDCPLPQDPDFKHIDPVDQSELGRYYAASHVLVLASREEGLALVQVQGLASGLPLVCTDRTGGADMVEFVDFPNSIRVVPHDSVTELADALRQALQSQPEAGIMRRVVTPENRARLSWRRYAERHIELVS
jgi:glycosyltransferase involved in cell wall biosynthesis